MRRLFLLAALVGSLLVSGISAQAMSSASSGSPDDGVYAFTYGRT